MNANTLYYNMPSSASSASSSDKSIAVLIKKAMAKLPMSHNTKKSVDEYYKNAMKEIVLKIKATEKAKKDALKAKEKAVKGSKAVKKPRAKKVGGSPRINDLVKVYMNQNEKLIDNAIKGYDDDKDINTFVNNLNSINLDGEETSVATNIMRLLMNRVLTDNNNDITKKTEVVISLYNSMKALKESYKSLK